MSQFVKEEVVTTRTLVEQKDAYGPDGIWMSVARDGRSLALVIGAEWEHASACYLSKKGLAELIKELTLIHEAL